MRLLWLGREQYNAIRMIIMNYLGCGVFLWPNTTLKTAKQRYLPQLFIRRNLHLMLLKKNLSTEAMCSDYVTVNLDHTCLITN